MYYGGPTAITQYSWCIVIVGVLWEKRTYKNESVLWEVDVYKLSVKAHILRKCMPINQFSL